MKNTCIELKNLEAACAWQHETIERLRAENAELVKMLRDAQAIVCSFGAQDFINEYNALLKETEKQS